MFIYTPARWTIFSVLILLVGAAWIWVSEAVPGFTTSREVLAPQIGFLAPDFSLYTPEGDKVTLSDLRGHPVVVNLWTSWCPPCRAEMPTLQRVYTDYQDKGLVVLAINATDQDTVQSAVEFGEQLGLTFPLLLDSDGLVSHAYQLRSLPSTFFIDSQGLIRELVVGGPMSEALLRVRVEELFKETP